MKLSEKSKALIEWPIAIFLAALCVYFYVLSYRSFTPLQAFRNSERTMNYGPSEIIKEVDMDDVKIYLARYKNWFSCQPVKKNLITWATEGGCVTGVPINSNEKINYYWFGSSIKSNKFLNSLFGYVNDPSIAAVTVEAERGGKVESFHYKLDNSKMFIFYWFDTDGKLFYRKITGTDKMNNIIYEYKFPH